MEREDAATIYAVTAEDAAIAYAAWYDSQGDYIFMDSEIAVTVERLSTPGARYSFVVSGEMVPKYRAIG